MCRVQKKREVEGALGGGRCVTRGELVRQPARDPGFGVDPSATAISELGPPNWGETLNERPRSFRKRGVYE